MKRLLVIGAGHEQVGAIRMARDMGKTIIAVTHDDNYYDVADRRITLSEGRVAAES